MERNKIKLKKIMLQYPFAIVIFVTILITSLLMVSKSNFENHFIKPTKENFYGQKEDTYFVLPYVFSKENSRIERELKILKEKNNIGYYWIDVEKYPASIASLDYDASLLYNNIPQYWVIYNKQQNDGTFKNSVLFLGSGFYTADEFNTQITWIKKNGVPVNEIGTTLFQNGVCSMQFAEISVKTEEESTDKYVSIKINVTNLKAKDTNNEDGEDEDSLNINLNVFTLKSDNKNIENITSSSETLEYGETKTVELKFTYDASKYNQDSIIITYNDFVWKINRPSYK